MVVRNKMYIVGLVLCVGLLALLWIRSTNTRPLTAGEIQPIEVWRLFLPQKISEISKSGDESKIFVKTSTILYAINSQSGNQIWSFEVGSQVEPSPAIEHNGIVYDIGNNNLIALDGQTGSEIWRRPLPDGSGQVVSVTDTIVALNQSSVDLRAYDSLSGELLWTTPTGRGPVKAYVVDNVVYILDQGINAVDVNTGRSLWRYGDKTIGDGIYHDGYIYYTSGEHVHAMNTETQAEAWEKLFPNNGFRKFYVNQNQLLITDSNHVYVLDKNSGILGWEIFLEGPRNLISFQDFLVILEGFKGDIHIIQRNTGIIMGTIDVSGNKFSLTEDQKLISTDNAIMFFEGKNIYAYQLP